MPFDATYNTCLDFYRSELVRQRDLLRSIWLWYIGPFVTGFIVFGWGTADMSPDRPQGGWWNAVPMAVIFLVVMGLNWRAARKLQRQVDELDVLRREV